MTIKEVSKRCDITQDTLRYYERVGMIPPVKRTSGGIRDYEEEDIRWIELIKCMRKSGLPVETLTRYVRLFQEGDSTLLERLELLTEQREILLKQRAQIDEMIDRLDYKITRYQTAVVTGKLPPIE